MKKRLIHNLNLLHLHSAVIKLLSSFHWEKESVLIKPKYKAATSRQPYHRQLLDGSTSLEWWLVWKAARGKAAQNFNTVRQFNLFNLLCWSTKVVQRISQAFWAASDRKSINIQTAQTIQRLGGKVLSNLPIGPLRLFWVFGFVVQLWGKQKDFLRARSWLRKTAHAKLHWIPNSCGWANSWIYLPHLPNINWELPLKPK